LAIVNDLSSFHNPFCEAARKNGQNATNTGLFSETDVWLPYSISLALSLPGEWRGMTTINEFINHRAEDCGIA